MNALVKWVLWVVLSRPVIHAIRWSESDRKAFEVFCRSQTGQRFLEFLRQRVARETFNAVYRDSVSANAYARGQQDILSLFLRLQAFPIEVAESGNLTELEQAYARGAPERESDEWRWAGGGGAIG